MSLQLLPMSLADFDALASQANSPHGDCSAPPIPLCWNIETEEDVSRMTAWSADLQRQQFLHLPNSHFFKIVDLESNEIAAVARWQFQPEGYRHEEHGHWETDPWRPKDSVSRSTQTKQPGLNFEMLQAFWEGGLEARKGWMVEGPSWALACLVTREGFRKRGAGSMLVNWGLKQAEKDNVPAYVEASPMGKPVYERCGFRLDGEPIKEDLSRYGFNRPTELARLSWYPPSWSDK